MDNKVSDAQNRAKGRPQAHSAEDISQSALALFEEKGFDNVSMDQIAKKVGISRRTLFRYFPNKTDILWINTQPFIDMLDNRLNNPPAGESMKDTIVAAFLELGKMKLIDQIELKRRLKLVTEQKGGGTRETPENYATRAAPFIKFFNKSTLPKLNGTHDLVIQNTLSCLLNAFSYWANHDHLTLSDVLNQSFYDIVAIGSTESPKSA